MMSVVVDCDSHVMEPADLWQTYLEPQFRDRAIRIEEENGIEKLIIGEQVVLQGVLAGLGGANLGVAKCFSGQSKYIDGCPPSSYDPLERAKMLDDWGVDRGVLFPTIGILPFPTDDNVLSNAYCRAYNTWQMEFFQTVPDRVVPVATLNWYDLDTAVEELKRCLKAGFKALFIPPEMVGEHRPGSTHFDPIWAICEEADIPGCFHVIVRFTGTGLPFSSWNSGKVGVGPTFTFGLGATGQLVPAMACSVLDGLFDRFPKLKIVSVEAGCGYAPYLMDRLDEKFHFFGQGSALEMKPSDYFRRNCYFVAEPEEQSIALAMDALGDDHVLWGSDFPHIDSRLDAAELILESTSQLDEERRRKVLGENAIALFNL